MTKKNDHILQKVKKAIENEAIIGKIMAKYNKEEKSKDSLAINRHSRIKDLLNEAGLTEDEKKNYTNTLSCSTAGLNVVLQRDIDEVMLNSFNPEWTGAWNGNTDVQLTLDFHAVITYITEYLTKDDTSVMKNLVDALKSSKIVGLKEKMSFLMNTWLTHRQMGEAETIYKISKISIFNNPVRYVC